MRGLRGKKTNSSCTERQAGQSRVPGGQVLTERRCRAHRNAPKPEEEELRCGLFFLTGLLVSGPGPQDRMCQAPGAGRGEGHADQAELPAFALVPRRVNSSLNFGPLLRSPAADFTFVS